MLSLPNLSLIRTNGIDNELGMGHDCDEDVSLFAGQHQRCIYHSYKQYSHGPGRRTETQDTRLRPIYRHRQAGRLTDNAHHTGLHTWTVSCWNRDW